jgi:hypothetical protein
MTSTIFLNITHGFQARMLLRSQIADELLRQGTKLVVCSVNADEPYFIQEFSHPQIVLESMPTRTSRWEDRLSTWRQYMLMNPRLGGTLNHKREVLKREQPLRYAATRSLNLFLGNLPFLRRTYMWGEAKLFSAPEFDPLLKRHRPDLLVTGTPGFNRHDVHALRSAKRLGIPTATVMLSWDNLTSKGFMNGTPDYLLVWSELMAQEAVTYHDYPADHIFQTGAAQFDHYYRSKETTDIPAWRRAHQVPQDAFLMMYGTINPAICGHEVDILNEIIRVMRSTRLPRKPFLWIRLHPQVVNGNTRRALEPFMQLQAEDVYVEVPPVNDSKLEWDLPKDDADHLKCLLAASDAVITTSSTLSIDAACAGTPIINVFFDGREVHPAQSVSRFKNYTHYAKILETGGIFVADSSSQFAEALCRYSRDNTTDAMQRERIIAQQIGVLDGFAGERTATKLLQIAGETIESTTISKVSQ